MKSFLTSFAMLVLASSCFGQQAISVGKGSYASFPPPGIALDRRKNIDKVQEVEQRPLFLVKDDGKPIPSNKWYQNLIFNRYGSGLWPYPHKVDATQRGLEIFYPTEFRSDGSGMAAEYPLIVGGRDFQPADSRAKDWTDWTVSFRMAQSPEKYFDVTLGEGMPYVWIECNGVQPVIALGGKNGKGSAGSEPASFFDLAARPISLPASGDALGLTYQGRSFGIFAPAGSKFQAEGDAIAVAFNGQRRFLVICPLPTAKDIAIFHQFAFAIPRDTKLSWSYDAAKGVITTKWKITAEPLQGSERRIIQGWLPHHWRGTTNDLALDGLNYKTARGQMRCAAGSEFTIAYPYNGILPNLPAPTIAPAEHPYRPQRMADYLKAFFVNDEAGFARDTYAGGKDIVRWLQAAFIARQTHDPSYQTILEKAKSELTNWLTYTPGEPNRFFAYYPHRKGLIGFNSSYGSEHFTDNHFHYGYFSFASGLLAGMDPSFAADYGDMAKLVAKTYANWDRNDLRFPFFRTFDIWRGHSFADGNGFPDGNNQESTSEAVQSWSGMILLGEATNDSDLTAAGIMGYTFETRATMEYWFNANGDVFPPEYKHPIAGMIWSNGNVWGTWFTASPAWIYGIQWIPTSPAASFFSRDPKFIPQSYAEMLRQFNAYEEREAARKPGYQKKSADVRQLGAELASYHLGYLMMADPRQVVEMLDGLWNEPGDRVAHSSWMANIYYEANSLRDLGQVDWTCHGDCATSMVYKNPATGERSFVVWNPTLQDRVVAFYEGSKLLGHMLAPAQAIGSSKSLSQ